MSKLLKRKSSVVGLVTDLSSIEGAVGLDSSLNYTSVATANYIVGATSVKNATEILDTEIKSVNDATGEVSGLTTTATTLVGGINELDAELGDVSTMGTTATDVSGAIAEHGTELGDLSTKAVSITATDVIGMINELEADKLEASANLSDVVDASAARTNLDVYATSEVDSAITAAQLAMGTNFDVATIAERDALINLDVADRVFVADDGDTKWALYKVSAIDANGSGTAWIKLSDQDALENSISASSIKASYESNADTNAFTDAEQTKVGHVSVTSAIDLDLVVQNDELNIDGTLATVSNIDIASSQAIKTYVDTQDALDLKIASNLSDVADVPTARTNLDIYSKAEVDSAISGQSNATKNVSGDITGTAGSHKVAFTVAPVGGVDGVAFGVVRVFGVDGNPAAYDEVEVTLDGTDATGKTFNISSTEDYTGLSAKAFVTYNPSV